MADFRRQASKICRSGSTTGFDLENSNVYWLGGSPCSGKTSIAGAIAARHGFSLFRCDDRLFDHLAAADPLRQPATARAWRLSWEGRFMRPVEEQVADVFAIYREEFEQLLGMLDRYPPDRPILAEGNAWLPELLRAAGIPSSRAAYLVPTPSFQRLHYSRREFINEILAQCSDPQKAFENWMARDARFGELVYAQAEAWGAPVLHVDGRLDLEEVQRWVELAWGLVKREP